MPSCAACRLHTVPSSGGYFVPCRAHLTNAAWCLEPRCCNQFTSLQVKPGTPWTACWPSSGMTSPSTTAPSSGSAVLARLGLWGWTAYLPILCSSARLDAAKPSTACAVERCHYRRHRRHRRRRYRLYQCACASDLCRMTCCLVRSNPMLRSNRCCGRFIACRQAQRRRDAGVRDEADPAGHPGVRLPS